jgi:hypothetical protein
MGERKGPNRRQVLIAATAALALATGLPGSASKALNYLNVSEGVANAHSIKQLSTFSLKELVELDETMDREFQRGFWENHSGHNGVHRLVGAEVNNSNTGTLGVYRLEVASSTDSETLEKVLAIGYQKTPDDVPAATYVGLQKLYDYYVRAGGKAKTPWVKVMFDVDNAGVTIWATLVDEKPRPNDSSDLKAGSPILGLRYRKESNDVSADETYRRIEDDSRIAPGHARSGRRPTR